MGERQCLCDKCKLARLHAEVERLREEGLSTFEALQEQGAQVERLREALRPFARLDYDIGDEWRDVCEAARRALGDTA